MDLPKTHNISLAQIAEIRRLEAERNAAIKAELKTLPVCKAIDGRLVWVQT
jgi:hypothetical protein